MNNPEQSLPPMASSTADGGTAEPPEFPIGEVGSGLAQLQTLAGPWSVARVITAPTLTQRMLTMEPGFARLPAPEIGTIANTLAFLFQHTMEWTPVGVRSLGGPGHFEQTESVTYGVSAEQGLELARTVGIEIGGEAKVPFGRVSTELSAEWSKLTRSTIRIEAQRETTTHLSYEVPAGGMDIALWRLDSRLTRRLILRPGKQLPPEPLPHWVEMAIAARPILIDIPTGITQAKTRMAETIHAVKVAEREP